MVHVIAALVLLVGSYAAVGGTRRLVRGLRAADSLDVVRGLRGLVVALTALAAVIGVLVGERGFLILGAVFLGEELYETGVLALIIRSGSPASGGLRPGVGSQPRPAAGRR
jgi:hypothetical protein